MALLPMNNRGELAALFCWSFLLVAVVGAGRWSLDALLARRREGVRGRETAAAI
jgi:putative oxidoreductase